jgi:hypothetical protein
MDWTREKLEALSHKQLNTLYENAQKDGSAKAEEVLDLIAEHGLLERLGGGYKRGHRVVQAIETFIRSDEGVTAAVRAAGAGEAPMAGVDPILQERVGPEYGHRDTTGWAGGFVKEEMEAAGWRHEGRKALPTGCKAKTAAFFVREDA